MIEDVNTQSSNSGASFTHFLLITGDGKTHYIRTELEQVDESHQVTITINEAFSTLTAIERLCSLPRDAPHCAIFFNFTMVPPVVSE